MDKHFHCCYINYVIVLLFISKLKDIHTHTYTKTHVQINKYLNNYNKKSLKNAHDQQKYKLTSKYGIESKSN